MSTRPPPPDSGSRLPPYSMAARVYRSSFRPVVVITGLITAGWTLVWAIGAFQDLNVDNGQKETKFATLDIVLGVLYMATCAIALFGVIAATMDKLGWVRAYTILAVIGGLSVVGAGFVRTVTHFIYKTGLINECTELVQGHDIEFRFGIWGPVVKEQLNATDAAQFCQSGWNHDSFTEIITLLVEIVLMVLFCGIAYTYYRQLLDPGSARAPSTQYRASDNAVPFPDHYSPPYLGYDAAAPTYAPPPGPPPEFGKAPAYEPVDAPKGYLDGKDDDDDPFSDFDGPIHKQDASREALV